MQAITQAKKSDNFWTGRIFYLPYAKGDVVVVFVTDALHFGVGGIYEIDRLARHEDLVRVMLVENLGCLPI